MDHEDETAQLNYSILHDMPVKPPNGLRYHPRSEAEWDIIPALKGCAAVGVFPEWDIVPEA